MADTLTELIARVRSVVRDASGDFITDGDITAYLNEALTDIAARQQLIESEFTGTTSGNTIALPPSAGTETLTVDYLSIGTEGDEVVFVDDEIFQSYVDAASQPVFTLGRIYNEVIVLYPTPETGTDYTLRCTSVPAQLSGGGDTHTLPLHMERKLVEYAMAKSLYKEGELERGDRFMALYENGLFPVASGRETQRPGPFTLVPIEGPFDVDWEGKHW